MSVLMIIAIAVISAGILYKAFRTNAIERTHSSGGVPVFKCMAFVASQSILMFALFVVRGLGKSFSNATLQMLFVIAIIAIGVIVCLSLHQRQSGIRSWALLYLIASVLNILLWELTPSLPE